MGEPRFRDVSASATSVSNFASPNISSLSLLLWYRCRVSPKTPCLDHGDAVLISGLFYQWTIPLMSSWLICCQKTNPG